MMTLLAGRTRRKDEEGDHAQHNGKMLDGKISG
jgi:hypothetical protein